ncbi:MAG: O-antigen ligase family protein [Fluviibacter sp.]
MSMIRQTRPEKTTLWFFSVLVAGLMLLIWQQPGTIALRNALGGILAVLISAQYWGNGAGMGTLRFVFGHPVAQILTLLTGWLLLGCFLFPDNRMHSFREFFGQWGISLVYAVLGASLAYFSALSNRCRQLLLVVVLAMGIQVVLHDVLDIWSILSSGRVPFRAAPLLNAREIFLNGSPPFTIEQFMIGGHGDLFSYVNNSLAGFLIAELAQRILLHKEWLPIRNMWLLFLLAAVFLCSYFLQYRNGNIGLMALLLTSTLFILMRISRRIGAMRTTFILMLVVVSVSTMGVLLVKSDPRWQRFTESAAVALQTDTYTAWITHTSPPEIPSGGPAELSAYERVAWIYEGSKLITKNPWGTGYNRNAWGDTLYKNFLNQGVDYKTLPGSHSHSGIIDFTIATGLPGLLLWLSLLGLLVMNGIRAFNAGYVAPGLVLIFVVTGFFGRSLVDSNMRDHMLQQFFFLAGLLFVLAHPFSGTGRENQKGRA